MTETVTSLLPFRTTMPVLLAGCTRHSERPSLSGGGAGGYRLYGIPRRHGAVPPCFRLGMGDLARGQTFLIGRAPGCRS